MVLDFEGIANIDLAFADELFRVFATAHPGVALVPINMSAAGGADGEPRARQCGWGHTRHKKRRIVKVLSIRNLRTMQ